MCVSPPSSDRAPPQSAKRLRLFTASALVGALVSLSVPAEAGPTGGTVVAGDALISTPGVGTTLIEQSSDRVVIDWDSFSIAPGEITQFVQGSPDAVALNRVTGGALSEIFGTLSADGTLFLVNPAGILVGQGGIVDVHGLVASTSGITNENFMAGRFTFDRPSQVPGASVINRGTISVKQAGMAALVAPGVENAGVIVADLGRAVLAGAQRFTVDLYGDGLIQFDAGPADDGDGSGQAFSAVNNGTIRADGGRVLMTTDAAEALLGSVVSMDGVIEARSVSTENGTIILAGGENGAVEVSGRLDAPRGAISIAGDAVTLDPDASLRSAPGGAIAIAAARLDVTGDGALGTLAAAPLQDAVASGGKVTLAAQSALTIAQDGLQVSDDGPAGALSLEGTAVAIGGPVDLAASDLTIRADSLALDADLTAATIQVETISAGRDIRLGSGDGAPAAGPALAFDDLTRLITPALTLRAPRGTVRLGSLDLAGAGFGALTVSGGAVRLSGDIVTGGRDFTVDGPAVLVGDTRLVTDGGAARFAGSLDSAAQITSADLPWALSVEAGPGAAAFEDTIGGEGPLAALSVRAGDLAAGPVTTLGAIDLTGMAGTLLAGAITSQEGPVTVAGPIRLAADTSVSSAAAVRLDPVMGGGFDLTLAASPNGPITLAGGSGLGVLSVVQGQTFTAESALTASELSVSGLTGAALFFGSIAVDGAGRIEGPGGAVFDGGPDGTFRFAGGLTALDGPVSARGTLLAGGGGLTLADFTPVGAARLEGLGGAAIDLGTVSAAPNAALTIDAAVLSVEGPVTLPDGTLTVLRALEARVTGPVTAETVRIASNGGTVVLLGALETVSADLGGAAQLRLEAPIRADALRLADLGSLVSTDPIAAGTLSLETIEMAMLGGPLTADSMSVDAPGGTITVLETLDAGRLSVLEAGSARFAGPVMAGEVDLTPSAGSVVFDGPLAADTLTTGPGPFSLDLIGGVRITEPVTIANTGLLTLGKDAGAISRFDGGLTATEGPAALSGSIEAPGVSLTLAAATLTGDTVLDVAGGAASGGGPSIALSTLNGAGFDLAVRGGPDTDVTLGGASALGDLSVSRARSLSLTGPTQAASLTTQDVTTRIEAIAPLMLASLTIGPGPASVGLTGGSVSVTGPARIEASGGTAIGRDPQSTATFSEGLRAQAAPVTVHGRMSAGGSGLALSTVRIAGDTVLEGTNGAAISLGDVAAADRAAAPDVRLSADRITAGALTLGEASAAVAVIAGSQASFAGAVSADSLALEAADGGRIDFAGPMTVRTITISEGAYALNLTGGASIEAAAVFANSGGVTLGDKGVSQEGPGDRFVFAGGLTSTASTTTVAGTVETRDAPLALAAVRLAGDSTLTSATNSGGGADISVSGPVDSADRPAALTVTAGMEGHVVLDGPVGQTAPLHTLEVSAGRIAARASRAAGDITLRARDQAGQPGTVVLAQNLETAGGDILIDGAVTISGQTVRIDTTGDGSPGGAVTLGAQDTDIVFTDPDAILTVTAGDDVTLARLGTTETGPSQVDVVAAGSLRSAGGTVAAALSFAAGAFDEDPAFRPDQDIRLDGDLTVAGPVRLAATGDLVLEDTLNAGTLRILIDGIARTGPDARVNVDDLLFIGSLNDGSGSSELIGSIRGIDTGDAAGLAFQTALPLNPDFLFNGCVVGVRCGQDDRVIRGINVFALTVQPVTQDPEPDGQRFSDLGNFELYRSLGLTRSWSGDDKEDGDEENGDGEGAGNGDE